jgi:SAM-dependent methyltransferase
MGINDLISRARRRCHPQRIELAVKKRFIAYQRLLERLEEQYTGRLSSLRILDLGAGFHYPTTILLLQQVHSVTGLDIEEVFAADGSRQLFRSLRRRMPAARAALSTAVRLLENRLYYRALQRCAGRLLITSGCDLRSYDGGTFPFPDSTFDCIVSNAVLEHVMDMETLIRECARVLVSSGMVDLVWHNYYSFSGNHLGEAVNRQHPWGHLTGEITKTPAHLNQIRPEQVLSLMKPSFEVKRMVGMSWDHIPEGAPDHSYEGEPYLSDSLRAKLAAYPDSLLLNVCFLVQAIKSGE